MSLARTGIVAVVALGLGVAMGFVLGGGPGERVVERVEPEEVATTDERSPAAPDDSGRAAERAPRRHVESSVAVSDLVEQAVATIEAPEVPVGDGRIEGRVTTKAGKPLPDIEVTASMVAPRNTGGRPWNDLAIAEQVTVMVQQRLLLDASTRKTTTDADGRYVLTDLPREPHRVSAVSDAYRIAHVGQFRPQVEPDATVNLLGDPIVKVKLALTLADGTEPEQAMVVFETGAGGGVMNMSWSPASRTIAVQPGTFRVVATTGDYKELTAIVPSLTLTHGDPPEELALQLLSRPGIAGRLVLPEGTPYLWAAVSAEFVGPDVTPESVAAGTQKANANQHDGYRFAIPDLAPGRYLLVAWDFHKGGVVASREIEVEGEMVLVDLSVAEPVRADHLEIMARGPGGEMLTGCQVMLRFKAGRRDRSTGRNAIERPDGSIWVRHLEASRTQGDGTYTAIVSHPSYGYAEREYRPGPIARVELTFEEPAFVDITVAGASAKLLSAGLNVSVGDQMQRRVSSGSGVVDAEGHVRVGPVQPGAAKLMAQVTSRSRNLVVGTQDIHVRRGDNAVTLSLPSLHTLRVEWGDPAAGRGKSIWLRPKTKGTSIGNIHENVPDSGRVVFRFIPAGQYELRVDRERRDVTLPGSDLIRF